jgi:hypothetical protein
MASQGAAKFDPEALHTPIPSSPSFAALVSLAAPEMLAAGSLGQKKEAAGATKLC